MMAFLLSDVFNMSDTFLWLTFCLTLESIKIYGKLFYMKSCFNRQAMEMSDQLTGVN